MGLLGMLRKMKRSEKEPRMLILGLDAAGKTTILKKLTEEEPSPSEPTKGFNVKSVEREGVKVSLWDIGGQQSIRTYWENYFEETDALLYVIDSSDKKRLEESGQELTKLLSHETLKNAVLLVLANKQDLESALPPNEIAEALNLSSIRDRKWQIQGCSAVTGDGLNAAMEWVVKAATG
jgi:ADP-ribosylation factor-like protein 3